MTAVVRAKDLIKAKRKQSVVVMGRPTDPKTRQRLADLHLKDTGHKMSDPHRFNLYMAYPIDHFGFGGAFKEAEQYIELQKELYLNAFEWKITGEERL